MPIQDEEHFISILWIRFMQDDSFNNNSYIKDAPHKLKTNFESCQFYLIKPSTYIYLLRCALVP